MSEPKLFDYQLKAENDISKLFLKYNKVLCVSPGGSGKTIISASIAKRFRLKQEGKLIRKTVAFFTHRDELFNQTRDKFLLFGNFTEPINADSSQINPNSECFVCMVETFDRRSKSESFLSYFKNVGLVFIDEAHRTDFNKIIEHFPNAKFIGWTATPISADRKKPLNSIWETIIEVAKVSDLQLLNLENPKVGVIPSDCYCLGKIDRNKLKKKGNEFDEAAMSNDFSDKIQIQNTIEKYFELGKGMKGLCFNVNIKHNQDVHNEFLSYGVESRVLHSDAKKFYGAPNEKLAKNWRKDTISWFKNTPGSILNNVGILTTGFDEPSVELIMTNYSTLSISKYIQCIVRGARPYQYPNGQWKEFYRLLDFGNNAPANGGNFGDGNNDIPWKDYFENPALVSSREGVGGMKTCPECGNLNPVAARFCSGLKEHWLSQEYFTCGYVFPLNTKEEDLIPRVMVKFFNDGINVNDMVSLAKMNGYKVEGVFYKILEKISELARKCFTNVDNDFAGTFILEEQFNFLLDIAYKKLKELSKFSGKRTYKESVKLNLATKLRQCGFVLDIEELVGKQDLEPLT